MIAVEMVFARLECVIVTKVSKEKIVHFNHVLLIAMEMEFANQVSVSANKDSKGQTVLNRFV